MVAGIFVYGGWNALRLTEMHAEAAKPLLDKTLGESSPDPVNLVRADALVKIIAGTTFATGKLPRLSALALAGSLVPTTAAGHPFWEAKGEDKQQQLTHFLKNAALLGGLLIAAADTEGRPSVGWRARRAAKVTSKAAREKLPS
ncbi:DoxX family membrane protein [Amycolatopsis sp. RM579]|uniref:DoxX family membrane protein n=1 Tax=Amycolatopsis pithecellobii TaxID=664692 RepID=A0A6N7ZBN3_9PSEU|nr:DoxX family membrane protein [Amycolatopsis pithecellobii]